LEHEQIGKQVWGGIRALVLARVDDVHSVPAIPNRAPTAVDRWAPTRTLCRGQ
jgi:hypothetical protein